ncbi:Beta-lactamase [Luteitalea pratensis]|uniref:Beta-lactamase n=1 Tax=Luteitalea pratensis TaxID=1855912 RepID=A0A143PH53_LUTPR|nr:serine hydrolase [Luteitalea pratensis]AMY07912.1 Beta-lactamase [Luteitalea pratensis]
MASTVTNNLRAAALIALALAIGAMGIYVGEVDDAPGAGGIGLLLMIGTVVLGVKAARNRLPAWAARTGLAVGVLIAAFAAVLTHAVALTVPLFAQPQDVPSVIDSAPSPQYSVAVGRARELVRAAVLEQNLPGVSVAVGAGGTIVWAEGFGWRDVDTRTPVTPKTRFNIGTAASAVTADVIASLGLTNTGADAATAWSPERIGEPGEDFPPLTLIRHNILQPLGLAPAEYPLPDDRATFYVPRSDDNPRRGRRLMYMRDLACCAGTMASYSTASDMVGVGLAKRVSVNGELAGGIVMSLTTLRDSGIVVAVLSNIAHANTSALSLKIGDAFAKQAR